jgi:hypothetical protein
LDDQQEPEHRKCYPNISVVSRRCEQLQRLALKMLRRCEVARVRLDQPEGEERSRECVLISDSACQINAFGGIAAGGLKIVLPLGESGKGDESLLSKRR